MKRNKFAICLSWVAVSACMGAIFWFSSRSGGESQNQSDLFAAFFNLPLSSFIIRKGAHFLEFTGLAVLLFIALRFSFGYFRPFLALIIAAVYAASDEIHQLFVEGRACRLFDWFTDCLGAASGIIILCLIVIIFNRKKRCRH